MIKQVLDHISKLIFSVFPALGDHFSGRITVTIQLRNGGIRDISMETSQKVEIKEA